ncbi:MAG: VOC family protein [Chloroflexi bacterium]|nr:VOC family protein [Chloroflexota bacterium]
MLSLGKVGIRCKDMDKSASFYRDILGLKEFIVGGLPADRLRFFSAGGGFLELIKADPEDKPQEVDGHAGINHFAFIVSGINELASDLKKKGVKILSEPREIVSGTWYAFIEDPNGMRIELLEFAKGEPWLDR